ncbi:ATP-binding cassette domain-containing protein, partial [Microbacterium sp. p3-SID336]|uniref:ATP-binding cassette domain-containing protein n=1 Tax=Microbacterium sp. p3-SID336 TaxID=2916212 RepID=UPI0021A7D3A7
RLVANGVAVMYVSHRMNEIAQVADVVTVLRDGQVVRTLPVADADVAVVTEAMVGEPAAADESGARRTAPVSTTDLEPALSVIGLADAAAVRDVSFDVAPGEIVGLAGLLSSGRTETLEVIAGLRRSTGGTIRIGGRAAGRLTPARALARGVALVPEDRKRDGLVLGLSVEENIAMSSFSRLSTAGVVRRGARRRAAERMRSDLDIKVDDVAVPVGTLSGGNQQKAVIGRCLVAGASIYLLDEPTRGVDVRAKQQIYEVIRSLADAGNAVVFASSEYEELLLLADRIVVLTDGRSRPAPPVPDLTLDRLLAEMMKEHTL